MTKPKAVTVDGEAVSLTPIEFNIYGCSCPSPIRCFPPGRFMSRSGTNRPRAARSAVAVHIRHLREKIEITPSDPRYLKVVWGQGYKMEGGRGV